MKKTYQKAIAVGIIATLILGAVLAFAMFMADRDMKEYYKEPRGYDNDFIGLFWYALFGISTIIMMFLIGLFSAWWTSDEASSVRETTKVTALASVVPLIAMVLFIMAIGVLMSLSYLFTGTSSFSPYILVVLAQFSTCCLAYAFIAIALSISGGLTYRLLIKNISIVGIIHAFGNVALVPSIIGGLLVVAVYVGGHYLTGSQFSLIPLFLEFFIFWIIAIAAGIAAVLISIRSEGSFTAVLRSSIISGLIVGISGALGQFFAAVLRRYNELGILMLYGPASLFDGIMLAFVAGTITYAVLKWNNERTPCKDAIRTGIMAGLLIAALALLPDILGLALSNTAFSTAASAMSMLCGGIFGMLRYVIVAAAGIMAVKLSRQKSLNDALTVSCICGSLAAVLLVPADAVLVSVRYIRYVLPIESTSGSSFMFETLSANYFGFLQGEPFQMLLVIAIAVFFGVIYGMWALNLRASGEAHEEAPSEK